MRYLFVNLALIFIGVGIAMAMDSHQPSNGTSPQSHFKTATEVADTSSMNGNLGMMMSCEEVHQQIRIEKDDDMLRKGYWKIFKGDNTCPVVSMKELDALSIK